MADAPKWKWVAAIAVGMLLWLAATIASQFVPQVVFGMALRGPAFALVALLQGIFGTLAVALALRIAGTRLGDVGVRLRGAGKAFAVGAAIAILFAAIQFWIVIPATGGAQRSDIVANAAQIGDSYAGLGGIVLLAWLGSLSEELFFRGLLVTGLLALFGRSKPAIVATVGIVTLLFAAGHGYQGWAGMIDTGIYGGLTLTLLYVWRGHLIAPIAAHALWNSIAAIMIFCCY